MKKIVWLFVLLLSLALLFSGCSMIGPELMEDSTPEIEDYSMNSLQVDSALFEQVKDDKGMYNVLVGFTQSPGKGEVELVRNMGGKISRTFNIVNAMTVNIPEAAISALVKQKKVRYVEPNYKVEALEQTVPWGIDRVFGEEGYSFSTWETTKGDGTAVAIIDTGIDENHEDLNLLGGINTIDNTDYRYDGNSHGTHVAGTVAALDNDRGVVGVGPALGLYAVKVLADDGSGTVDSVVAGIEWAVGQDIPVLNMSLGSSTDSTTMREACNNAYSAGHLLVAAAGNSGNPPGRGDNVGYPAAYDSVIAVAASSNNDKRASFSSTGPDVELIAPGVDILSTIPGNEYGSKSGTSMASPHAAGAAALTWAANNNLNNIEVREILQNTAEDLGLSSNHQGYGLVRADSAVDAAAVDVIYAVEVTPESQEGFGSSGDIVTYTYTVSNTGTENDSYNLNITGTAWTTDVVDFISVNAGGSKEIIVSHNIPDEATDGDSDSGTLTAVSVNYSEVSDTSTFTTTVQKEEMANDPVIDIFVVTDTSNPAWTRVEVEWEVSDGDGNLSQVISKMWLLDGAGNRVEIVDSESSVVSGSEASGTHELRSRGGHGESYSIELIVTDTEGNEISDTQSIDL